MMREYTEPDGTFSMSTQLGQEMNQYRKLLSAHPGLSDDEMAHRMTTTVKQIGKIRKLLGG
jgi:hypothetical protein